MRAPQGGHADYARNSWPALSRAVLAILSHEEKNCNEVQQETWNKSLAFANVTLSTDFTWLLCFGLLWLLQSSTLRSMPSTIRINQKTPKQWRISYLLCPGTAPATSTDSTSHSCADCTRQEKSGVEAQAATKGTLWASGRPVYTLTETSAGFTLGSPQDLSQRPNHHSSNFNNGVADCTPRPPKDSTHYWAASMYPRTLGMWK